MWVGAVTTSQPKLTLAQIPAVDWIVQFDPPDDPRGIIALTSSCKDILILVRLHSSGRTNSTRGMYPSSIFPLFEFEICPGNCFPYGNIIQGSMHPLREAILTLQPYSSRTVKAKASCFYSPQK